MDMDPPTGTIVFTTVGRPYYGFDVFSVHLSDDSLSERRLTDGRSVNFNGQFVDEDGTLVFISERTGSAQIFLNRPGEHSPEHLHFPPGSLFHDRPVIKSDQLYFISAHERPDKPFRSWSALYSTGIHEKEAAVRLTPYGSVDYSPAISYSGNLIAVASYESRPWGGEFHHLQTDIVIFEESNPGNRVLACEHGGWPTWSGDSSLYFHRRAHDGWWSIYRIDLPPNFMSSPGLVEPVRITPPGIHCFTPAAMHSNNSEIAVATRRKGSNHRHIEIFNVVSGKFNRVTERINPNLHHYSPFISPESNYLGYHRFRGESGPGESTVRHLDYIASPCNKLRMFRLNGSFPAFSPSGRLIAFNHDLDTNGLNIVKSDGSKRWTLIENQTAFCNSWSPDAADNVIFTSIGPIFQSVGACVQIARVTFDPQHLSNACNKVPVDIKILTKEGTGNNAFPSCSPDGKSIVFRSGRSGHKNLYIVDAISGETEGEIRQLTEGPWIDTMPSWSPDGNLIAFSSNRHDPENMESFGIYLVKPDGTGVTRVRVAGVEEERERVNHVCFSGDGEWLLFTGNLGGVTAEPVGLPHQYQPYGDLYVVRLDGSGLRRLTWNAYENGTPAWHQGAFVGEEGNGVLRDENGEDRLRGQFDELLWIRCDL